MSSTLSSAQEKALSFLPLVPTMLSLVGSSSIIYMVFRIEKENALSEVAAGNVGL